MWSQPPISLSNTPTKRKSRLCDGGVWPTAQFPEHYRETKAGLWRSRAQAVNHEHPLPYYQVPDSGAKHKPMFVSQRTPSSHTVRTLSLTPTSPPGKCSKPLDLKMQKEKKCLIIQKSVYRCFPKPGFQRQLIS